MAEGTSEGDRERREFEEALSGGEGDVVRGTVLRVTPDHIVVDVGLKGEGFIPVEEFRRLGESPAIGDTVYVKILQAETEEGTARLSRARAAQESRWDEIRAAHESGGTIRGTVVEEVKGGFRVEIGLREKAFLPASQASTRRRVVAAEILGKEMDFHVKEIDRRRKNVVVSRRALLEKEAAARTAETLARIKVGEVIEGTVKNVANFGVFVDIGGIDGLITLGDLTWSGFVKDAGTIVKRGQTVRVKVLEFDPSREPPRIRLGLKQAQGDPWDGVADRFRPGSTVEGTVKSFTNFGAFVELEPGVDGLIHISEISYTERVEHPSKVMNLGAKVAAKVLAVDPARRKISLSLRQVGPDPWSQAFDEYPANTRVRGVVTSITQFGAFVRLPSGVEGLVHKNDLAWGDRAPDPKQVLQEGQEVEVVVLKVDVEGKRISLGMKQATADPWAEVARRYHKGAVVEVPVVRTSKDGAYVDLGVAVEGVEGFIPLGELAREKPMRVEDAISVGQTVKARVVRVDKKEREVHLSVRALLMEEERRAVRGFQETQSSTGVTLGELVGKQLEKLDLKS